MVTKLHVYLGITRKTTPGIVGWMTLTHWHTHRHTHTQAYAVRATHLIILSMISATLEAHKLYQTNKLLLCSWALAAVVGVSLYLPMYVCIYDMFHSTIYRFIDDNDVIYFAGGSRLRLTGWLFSRTWIFCFFGLVLHVRITFLCGVKETKKKRTSKNIGDIFIDAFLYYCTTDSINTCR